jgi:hypothetical protein
VLNKWKAKQAAAAEKRAVKEAGVAQRKKQRLAEKAAAAATAASAATATATGGSGEAPSLESPS